jgi:hypothetical protein
MGSLHLSFPEMSWGLNPRREKPQRPPDFETMTYAVRYAQPSYKKPVAQTGMYPN